METKRLMRSSTERMLFGVCGGIGEFLGIDPTVVRLVFLITLFTWPGPAVLLAYLVLVFVMPQAPLSGSPSRAVSQDAPLTGEIIEGSQRPADGTADWLDERPADRIDDRMA